MLWNYQITFPGFKSHTFVRLLFWIDPQIIHTRISLLGRCLPSVFKFNATQNFVHRYKFCTPRKISVSFLSLRFLSKYIRILRIIKFPSFGRQIQYEMVNRMIRMNSQKSIKRTVKFLSNFRIQVNIAHLNTQVLHFQKVARTASTKREWNFRI